MDRKLRKPPNPEPIEPTERLILEVPKGGNLDEVLRAFASALNNGSTNAAVLTAINNLTSFVKENLMSLKDDVKALTDTIGTIEENTAALGQATELIGADIEAFKRELTEVNERSNVDLLPLIQRAGNIGSAIGAVNIKLREVAGPNAGSDPQAPTGGETGTEPGGGVITGDNE